MIEHLPKEDYESIEIDGHVYTRCTVRQIVTHTIGLDRRKPRKIKGRMVYEPYRNYFDTYVGEAPWPELEDAGYAAHGKVYECPYTHRKTTDYYLTRKGLDWVGEELGITIVNPGK